MQMVTVSNKVDNRFGTRVDPQTLVFEVGTDVASKVETKVGVSLSLKMVPLAGTLALQRECRD